jgi:NADPH:quinone reductase-like Zn-dependent oxidoreductase
MSGTVAGLGPGAAGVAVGDRVYGLIPFDRDGAAADYVTIAAADLSPGPRTVPHAAAAALQLAALTAWQALVDHAALEPGERVLVHGGAGGVGVYAVQLAVVLGGHVTATGAARDADFVRDLGADGYLAQEAGRFEDALSGMDVVIDTVGGATTERSYAVLRPGGRLVTLGAPPAEDQARSHGVHAMFFVVSPDSRELAQLADLVAQGRLQPVVSQTFPLSQGSGPPRLRKR